MKVIHPTLSTEHYWKELVYTYVRLDANPKTKPLAVGVRTQLEKFEDISRSERETEWAVVQDQAQTNAADERVEGYLRTMHSAVLNLVKQNRKDSLYKTLFPSDFSSFLRTKPKEKKEGIERMRKVLERGDYEDEFREAQELLFDKVLSEIDEIQGRKIVLEERQFKHQTAVQAWKNDINTLRRGVYGDLLKFPESSDAAWLKSFFRVARKSPKLSALAKSKKEVARLQKKLEELTLMYAQATSESAKAVYKVAMEEAKTELDEKYREFIKHGGKEPNPKPDPQPVPSSDGLVS